MKYVRPNQGVRSKQCFKGVILLYAPIHLLRLTTSSTKYQSMETTSICIALCGEYLNGDRGVMPRSLYKKA